MAKKKQTQADVQDLIRVLFPDEAERLDLLQMALRKLHPEAPKDDALSEPIAVADILREMVKIRTARQLLRLILAMKPERPNRVEALLGDCEASMSELSRTFGVGESTIENDWIPAGMPVGRN